MSLTSFDVAEKFKKASAELGITDYPEELDIFAKSKYSQKFDPADTSTVLMLQKEENFFGNYCDLVLDAANQLTKHPDAHLWAKIVSEYIYGASCEKARNVKIPDPDGSLLFDMLPLLILIPSMVEMRRIMAERGFDEDIISENMGIFHRCIGATAQKIGRPALDRHYFKWTILFLKGMIFPMDGFKFEIKKLSKSAIYLENIQSGELVPLINNKTVHASGAILGSAGFEDESGSFLAQIEENDRYFSGYTAQNGKVIPEICKFSKDEWRIFASPGDCAISIHIPKGTDISDEAVSKAVANAKNFVRKHYPELSPVCIVCHSWLLDPTLANILGQESKIVKFGCRFTRIPVKSAGREVFSFVFPPQIQNLEDLPENTRLERGLKALYLQGGFVHAYEGIFKL